MFRVIYKPDYNNGTLTVMFVGSRVECIAYIQNHPNYEIIDAEGRLCCCH